jgi:hypothetical protein
VQAINELGELLLDSSLTEDANPALQKRFDKLAITEK